MSLARMAGIGCLIAAQKLLPSRAAIDVSVALTLVGLGIVIIMPSAIPGLVPTMTPMRPARAPIVSIKGEGASND
jgi:hypothetical protein